MVLTRMFKWLLSVPLLVIGLIMGFYDSVPEVKKIDVSRITETVFASVFPVSSNLYLKLRQIKLFRSLNNKSSAMAAWMKKVEDKTFALVGGAGIFISEELPVI